MSDGWKLFFLGAGAMLTLVFFALTCLAWASVGATDMAIFALCLFALFAVLFGMASSLADRVHTRETL